MFPEIKEALNYLLENYLQFPSVNEAIYHYLTRTTPICLLVTKNMEEALK